MKRWLLMMMCAVWFLMGNLSFAMMTSPLGMGSSPAWGSGMPALESFDDDDYWDDDRWEDDDDDYWDDDRWEDDDDDDWDDDRWED